MDRRDLEYPVSKSIKILTLSEDMRWALTSEQQADMTYARQVLEELLTRVQDIKYHAQRVHEDREGGHDFSSHLDKVLELTLAGM